MSDDDDKTVFYRPGSDAPPVPPPAAGGGKALPAKLICLDDSMLAVTQKGLTITIAEEREQVLGRDKNNPLFVDSNRVSRKHAVLYAADGTWGIRDLNSTNGVFVNGKRVEDSKLKTGDLIKLGTVPFRFEEEKPAPPAKDTAKADAALARFSAMDNADSEKTMMFGDVRASSKLLAAQEKKEPAETGASAERPVAKPAVRPAAKPAVKPAMRPAAKPARQAEEDETTIMEVPNARSGAKLPIGKIVLFTVIGAIVLSGGYFAYGIFRSRNIVENKRDAVNRFVREAAAAEDPKRFAEERKALATLKLELMAAIADAPDKPELGLLLERVTMLEFERNLYEAMSAGKFNDARDVIDSTRRKLAGMKQSGAASAQTDGENLLAAMVPIVALREFGKAFPDPQHEAEKPTQARLDDLLKQKAEFAKVQRTVNMDLVRHPFLGRLLDQGNQDIRLLERWELAIRAAATK